MLLGKQAVFQGKKEKKKGDDSYLTPYTKYNWLNVNVKTKTTEILGEIIGINLRNFEFGNGFS